MFTRPDWQTAVITRNASRGVPDMAADADPDTGYNVLVAGEQLVIGGTSAVAPLIAGLIVLLNQALNQRLGFVNPTLYGLETQNCFHDITIGNDGAYSATFGWDPCTGLGSPIGGQILQALQGATHKVEHAPSRTVEGWNREQVCFQLSDKAVFSATCRRHRSV